MCGKLAESCYLYWVLLIGEMLTFEDPRVDIPIIGVQRIDAFSSLGRLDRVGRRIRKRPRLVSEDGFDNN